MLTIVYNNNKVSDTHTHKQNITRKENIFNHNHVYCCSYCLICYLYAEMANKNILVVFCVKIT